MHQKFLERAADIFLEKYNKEGLSAAQEWADRLLPADLQRALVPIIQKKKGEGPKKA